MPTNFLRSIRSIKYCGTNILFNALPTWFIRKKVDSIGSKWLFIIGCNNSGTTLLKSIIERHPNIVGIEGEGQYRTDEFITDRDLQLNRLFSERLDIFREIEESVSPLKVKYDWLWSVYLRLRNHHRYILEKTTVNSVRVNWLRKHFPGAYFIIIFREAYAVVEGMRRKEGVSIQRAAEHWKITNELILSDSKSSPKFLIIKYEKLTETPQKVINDIWTFLQLPKSSQDLRIEYEVHGRKSIIKNQNKNSLTRLTKEDLKVINKKCSVTQQKIDALESDN